MTASNDGSPWAIVGFFAVMIVYMLFAIRVGHNLPLREIWRLVRPRRKVH